MDHLYFVLLIESKKFTTQKITELIGINPEVSQNIGDIIPYINKPRKCNTWTYDTKSISGIDINIHWKYLNEKLPTQANIAQLMTNSNIELFIRGTFETMSPLIEISNKTLSEISEYGFSLGYDISDLCP